MKKRMIFVVGLIILLAVGTVVASAVGDPGSDSDPIVTKSYVDGKIAEVKSMIGVTSEGSASTGGVYAVIQVAKGKQLLGGEGTEVVLRAGEATAIGNESNGISDMTAGKDLMTGDQVSLNHLLLIPRADGRGITANTDTYVMVRGTYTIK